MKNSVDLEGLTDGMTIAEVCYALLERAGEPMHYRDLTELLLQVKPLKTKTPADSVYASMLTDARQRFERVAPGMWDIAKRRRPEEETGEAAKGNITARPLQDGFININKDLRRIIPSEPEKATITLISGDTASEHFLDNKYGRIYGLTEWYRANYAQVGDKVVFETVDREALRYNIFLESRGVEEEAEEEETTYDRDYAEQLHEKLLKAHRETQEPAIFEELIAEAFDFLGLQAEIEGGAGRTDVLVRASIGPHSYRAIVDGKTTAAGNVGKAQVNFETLKKHREGNNAEHCMVVGPGFSKGDLETSARENKVTLIKTATLAEILQLHARTPFSLVALEDLFTAHGIADDVIADTFRNRSRAMQEERAKGLRILQILLDEYQSFDKTVSADVIEHLINTRPRYKLTEPVTRDDVAFFLQMFSREPFGFVQQLPDGKYIVTMSERVIANKLALLARSIESLEDSAA
ncbi:MAG: winged helix-turn-helix domain-containing protein [Anaerolineae bacterium]